MKNIRELVLWIGASTAVSIAIVLGHAVDNIGQVMLHDLVRPVFVLSAISAMVVIIGFLACKSFLKILPAGLLISFAYLQINNAIFGIPQSGFITLLIMLSFLLVLHMLLRPVATDYMAKVNCFIALVMALGTGIVLLAQTGVKSSSPVFDRQFADETSSVIAEIKKRPEMYPDIFYIVPDRYGSAQTLLTEFEYDNSQFYDDLRNLGFSVVENGVANYPKTFQSLASVLNAEYLDEFTTNFDKNTIDHRPAFTAIEDNLAQNQLNKLGYDFINFGNRWGPAKFNRNSKENYQGYADDNVRHYFNIFEYTLLKKTFMPHAMRFFGFKSSSNHCSRTKNKFNRLQSIGNTEIPEFIYVHLLIPHGPLYIDAKGNCIASIRYEPELDNWMEYKRGYIGYLQYFNASILNVLHSQLNRRGDSGRPMIFVIQSDEGPFPREMRRGKYDFMELSNKELVMKMGNINAIMLGDGGNTDVDIMKTPVNNWRIIFQSLLDHRFQMLEQRAYIYPEFQIYNFRDVSTVLGLNPSSEEPEYDH
jgi:hypothetical protein